MQQPQTHHQVNNYEAKWRTQTHSGKFKIIPICRKRTETIEISDEKLVECKVKSTVSELDINIHGVTQQIKTQSYDPGTLKLFRFNGLSFDIKLKLCNAIVRSTLLHPIIPLYA